MSLPFGQGPLACCCGIGCGDLPLTLTAVFSGTASCGCDGGSIYSGDANGTYILPYSSGQWAATGTANSISRVDYSDSGCTAYEGGPFFDTPVIFIECNGTGLTIRISCTTFGVDIFEGSPIAPLTNGMVVPTNNVCPGYGYGEGTCTLSW